jgi:prefoldin subunit 5
VSQTLTLRQITNKISHLEEEINILRAELDELRQKKASTSTKSATQVAYAWADKEAQRRWINQVFTSVSITNMPIGSQTLQQRMSQSGLSHNELSRDVVEAREE